MINKIKYLFRDLLHSNKFLKNVGVLIGGTAGSQLILLIASPILTRLYTPDQFGILAIFGSIISVVSVISSLRYEMTIPLVKESTSAINIVALCLITLIFTTLIFFVSLFLMEEYILNAIGIPEIKSYLWILPIGIALAGLYKIFRFWAIRNKNFKGISKTKFKQVITMSLVQIIGYKFGSIALVGGHVLGHGMGSTSLSLSYFKIYNISKIRLSNIYNVALRYYKYPIYSTWSSIFNTTGSHLPPLLFAILFSPAVAGFYALAHKAVMVPLNALGSAVADVFYSDANLSKEQGKLTGLIQEINESLIYISLPPILLLILTGPEIFQLVFGEKWITAGTYVQWLAPWMFMVFITSPISRLFLVLDKQVQESKFQVIILIIRMVSIFIGYIYGGAKFTIILFSFVSTSWRVFLLCYLLKISGVSIKKMLVYTIRVFIQSIPIISIAIVAYMFYNDRPIIILASVGISFLIICVRNIKYIAKLEMQ